ncbi:pirin family protein [Commensalibacter oyaizuii]|uniref:Pirin family protein n=1 Tax=Commensalibacter oyaizuii TaxID=3043873 RepID=A0ABT6Q2R5_9PROT|nr:pirin family protein [Commensalibacter sp. TBRC 16381]MDI2091431.1 pirin family protein [Commensalibacter sp. TBRC 16381]
MKKVIDIRTQPAKHWVGDGFPVRTLFSYHEGKELSPFLLLDYASPYYFAPSIEKRGVGQHPHRGFETVTIMYKGEVAHRDSTGKSGIIGPGDIQWMTAGSGILHDEFHSEAFTQSGGEFEVVQLWINLPAHHKMTPPNYQTLTNNNIPTVHLSNHQGYLRVIAGQFQEQHGPANTFTPMNIFDVNLKQDATIPFTLPIGWTTIIVVLHGSITINNDSTVTKEHIVLMDTIGQKLEVKANCDAAFLVLNGEPINEDVVGYGPFVMNTKQEITQAIQDFNSGNF